MLNSSSRTIKVDDTDPHIVYNGGPWILDDGSESKLGNFGPPYQNTLHGVRKGSGSLSYRFQGSAVMVYGTMNIRNTSGVIDPKWACFVDGVAIPTIPPFQFPENNYPFCQQSQLPDGDHIITVNAMSNGQAFWFDDIEYTPSLGVPLDNATIVVDHMDPSIHYGPGWLPLGDTANMTSTNGAKMNLQFTGVGLSWVGFIPTELPHGPAPALYTVDDLSPVAFVLPGLPPNSSTLFNQVFFATPALPYGSHNLTVVYQGGNTLTPLTLSNLLIQNGCLSVPEVNTTSTTANATHPGVSTASTRSRAGTIVGCVFGTIIAILLLAILFVFMRRWYRRYKKPVLQPTPGYSRSFDPAAPLDMEMDNRRSLAPSDITRDARYPPFTSVMHHDTQSTVTFDPPPLHPAVQTESNPTSPYIPESNYRNLEPAYVVASGSAGYPYASVGIGAFHQALLLSKSQEAASGSRMRDSYI
ncbi:hypothetical protein K443DRAFT_675866 [Laccaria amethystina LaAM-08-1]|uniref:Uncharacterized protein n=1 Tax=Laccaria amethystina LaAM-08-1 TaxID=1095629 RepID=A0A0C9WXY4_9AGAR|nr:hypothetical protein K443DRAFT_675866 [Laccaria amethystina LaAM-08-1]